MKTEFHPLEDVVEPIGVRLAFGCGALLPVCLAFFSFFFFRSCFPMRIRSTGSYWHDLRKDKLNFPRRNFSRGCAMVWAAIASTGRVKLYFVSKKMNTSDYVSVIRRGLLPSWRRIRHESPVFMQDNAPIHASRST